MKAPKDPPVSVVISFGQEHIAYAVGPSAARSGVQQAYAWASIAGAKSPSRRLLGPPDDSHQGWGDGVTWTTMTAPPIRDVKMALGRQVVGTRSELTQVSTQARDLESYDRLSYMTGPPRRVGPQ